MYLIFVIRTFFVEYFFHNRMNRLFRLHSTFTGRHSRGKQTRQAPDGLSTWMKTTLRSLSSEAVVYDSTFSVPDCGIDPPGLLPTINFSPTTAEKRRIVRQLSLHPLYDWSGSLPDGLSPEICRHSRIVTRSSRRALEKLLVQSQVSCISSDFVHVDLLLKRESKMQVSILIDMAIQNNEQLVGFYLAPVDATVTHSFLSKALGYSQSLRFIDLSRRLMNSDELETHCIRCDRRHILSESDCVGVNISCCTPGCVDSVQPSLDSSLHPGGNRHYWGPTVPDLRNVWIGHIDQIAHKNDRVGIISASVFRLFRDPANTSRRITLPSPDPRVQWAILPIIED